MTARELGFIPARGDQPSFFVSGYGMHVVDWREDEDLDLLAQQITAKAKRLWNEQKVLHEYKR